MRMLWGLLGMMSIACGGAGAPAQAPSSQGSGAVTSFADDLAFLREHGSVQVLESPSGGRVAVSAKYQGRVMTSAVEPGGRSLGWIFRKFILEGKTGTQFDNYGGEDRFWLGPEGGQYSLYFPPGKPFVFANWQTPNAFQTGEWKIASQSATSIRFEQAFAVSNYAGTEFKLRVNRTIRLTDGAELASRLGTGAGPSKWVAFESENRVANTGDKAWEEPSGLLSIWILAMFTPTPDTFVVVPFEKNAQGPIVNDTYFGKVPADRLRVNQESGYMVFRCDGQHRSKIGLRPARAKNMLGSYSRSAHLLTIVQFDKPADATRYVNSLWELQKEPYGGDVLNSYNDGPTEPGKPPLGGFYEMESSSPALALKPGAEAVHRHATFHFVGDEPALDAIAERVLGVRVSTIASGL